MVGTRAERLDAIVRNAPRAVDMDGPSAGGRRARGGLPPLFIVVGEAQLLLDDAVRLARWVREQTTVKE